jgi:hypothetical protein
MECKTEIAPEHLEELARAEQRKYKAEWRQKNKDKVRDSNKKYWAKRALKRLEAEKGKDDTI